MFVVPCVTLKDDLQNGGRVDLSSFLVLVFLPTLLDFEILLVLAFSLNSEWLI